MKRRILGVCSLIGVIVLVSLFIPLPREHFRIETIHSLKVVDRRGVVLREFLNDQQGRGQWVPLEHISGSLLQATIAVEDRRFWYHPGVDPVAIVRAVIDDIKARSFRSGGSTLTQQVIRNVYHHPRSLPHKLLEAWYALRLERMMGKKDILEQYLNRAPYGNQLYGVEAAARWYFGKPADRLSLAESAFLAALPNSPSQLNPYLNVQSSHARKDVILRRMLEQGMIGKEEFERGIEEPIRILPLQANFRAPHAVELAIQNLKAYPKAALAETTIDYALQQDIHWIVKGHLATLRKKNVTNAAVVVIENSTRSVRSLLGSVDYFDERTNGQVNGALALRQPGSAIKPFMYGIALESRYSPATILADVPTQIPDDRGDYIPENYDRRYHGPVRLRTALACSYNVPAVRVLRTLGVESFLQRLGVAGFTSLVQPALYYGYGLTLGNGEVTLLELTNAYASLAKGGMREPIRLLQSVHLADGSPVSPRTEMGQSGSHLVFEDRVAFLLADILSDPVARRPAFGNSFRFPFPCAVKTGTTKDYRDNWTVGFTTEYTVGVWVGNFSGSPMRGVSGVTGAGQIFSDIMTLLHGNNVPRDFGSPPGLTRLAICPRSGKLPTEACSKSILEWFRTEDVPKERCAVHRFYRIADGGKDRINVYEVVPPEFRSWAQEEGIPVPPPGAARIPMARSSPQPEETNRRPQFSIFYPVDGDHFKIDPVLRSEYQSIKVLGTAPEKADSVLLRVDRDRVSFNPSGTWWTLKPGKHVMQIEAMLGRTKHLSEPVVVEVE